MNHIAVERNRRRLMNDHLDSLRSLMPPSYIHKGDQASIIGGAIDFVKELEQFVQSLEAQKRMREIDAASSTGISPTQYSTSQQQCDILVEEGGTCEEERTVMNKSEATEIEVAAVQNHVNFEGKESENSWAVVESYRCIGGPWAYGFAPKHHFFSSHSSLLLQS
ncbi:MAX DIMERIZATION MAD [Salix koriyanagi]|uniref:MAX DIMERIZATION MAD n=1 Tax=Salix koriyanagi TaxID=2511006 RepID=A0A9Q0U4C7_9ROSI|nr:MAX DIMERIZATION MAD [Salix koriyanagi]